MNDYQIKMIVLEMLCRLWYPAWIVLIASVITWVSSRMLIYADPVGDEEE